MATITNIDSTDSSTTTTQEDTMNNTTSSTTETTTEKKEQPKMSFWARCKKSWKAGAKVADGYTTVALVGVCKPDNQIARGMLAGGQALQTVGAVGAIASGVPGWVALCLIGGNSSILGGFILGLRGGIVAKRNSPEVQAKMAEFAKKQQEEIRNKWNAMSQEEKDAEIVKMHEQLEVLPTEMVDVYKAQVKDVYGVEL